MSSDRFPLKPTREKKTYSQSNGEGAPHSLGVNLRKGPSGGRHLGVQPVFKGFTMEIDSHVQVVNTIFLVRGWHTG